MAASCAAGDQQRVDAGKEGDLQIRATPLRLAARGVSAGLDLMSKGDSTTALSMVAPARVFAACV